MSVTLCLSLDQTNGNKQKQQTHKTMQQKSVPQRSVCACQTTLREEKNPKYPIRVRQLVWGYSTVSSREMESTMCLLNCEEDFLWTDSKASFIIASLKSPLIHTKLCPYYHSIMKCITAHMFLFMIKHVCCSVPGWTALSAPASVPRSVRVSKPSTRSQLHRPWEAAPSWTAACSSSCVEEVSLSDLWARHHYQFQSRPQFQNDLLFIAFLSENSDKTRKCCVTHLQNSFTFKITL